MLHQQRLQLGRGDTKAFVFDHLFLAVYDVGVAVGVYMADIAGVEPTVAQSLGCFIRGFPVTLHNLWTAYDDLAIFTYWQLSFTSLNVDDLLYGIVDRHADAIDAHKRCITRLRVCE